MFQVFGAKIRLVFRGLAFLPQCVYAQVLCHLSQLAQVKDHAPIECSLASREACLGQLTQRPLGLVPLKLSLLRVN